MLGFLFVNNTSGLCHIGKNLNEVIFTFPFRFFKSSSVSRDCSLQPDVLSACFLHGQKSLGVHTL